MMHYGFVNGLLYKITLAKVYFLMGTEKQLKTYVVQNPVSGLSDAPTIRDKISQVMLEHQIPFEIYQTTGKEDLHEIVKAAIKKGFERFVAIGGDGTISGVASGLVNTKIPLVIIPTGTVNALARELQVPFNLDEAVRWWVDGDTRSKFIDVIEARDRFYLLGVSAGASAKIMKEAKREDIHRFGVLVYIWNALKRVKDVPTHRFQLTVDGKQVSFRASELMIANSGLLMGLKALRLDPNASLDSGQLSVCHARMNTFIDYARLVLKVATTPPEKNTEVDCLDARREIRITGNHKIPVQGDGEQIGYTPITVKLIPHSLHVIMPPWQKTS